MTAAVLWSRQLLSIGGKARTPLRVAFVVVAAATLSAKAWALHAGVVRVTTDSVQPGYYRTEPLAQAPLSRTELVCVDAQSSAAPKELRDAHLKERLLVKHIAGLPGDVIDYDGERVLVNGRALERSAILAADSRGRALPRPVFPIVLGADEVWVASDNARGFDSRYFGPVARSALSCRAELVWAR